MPTTTTREQERWNEIVRDPQLRDLPYKVETNTQGQILLRPHENRRSFLQKSVQGLLDEQAPDGHAPPEFAIATEEGVKVPDVVWMSPQRRTEMKTTGDPSTLAPELCVEILSASNTVEERVDKWALYRAAGAEEGWIVEADGRVRFFRDEEIERSDLAPDFPAQIS